MSHQQTMDTADTSYSHDSVGDAPLYSTLHGQNMPPISKDSHEEGRMTTQAPSHTLSPHDPDNPMRWPLHRRLYASAVAWFSAYVIAFGITAYTAGLNQVMAEFSVSMPVAILGMSLYIFGIAFAPIYTPHLAERHGRSKLYLLSLFLFMLFELGASRSGSFASLAVCRFLAGFTGGPCLVLIEGTFADVWSANTTNTYYAFLGIAAYFGAASGPLIGNFVVPATNWRWTQYLTIIFAVAAFLFAVGMPETYGREIPRRRNRYRGLAPLNQPPAESGVTIAQMFRITVLTPLRMLVTEPIVILCSFYLGLNFAVVFQWFITVPVVLSSVYKFTPQNIGLAFTTAIAGASLAAITSIVIELGFYRKFVMAEGKPMPRIEYRLIPAMIGGFLQVASLFWIGWTASPNFHWASPVLGTMVYVWGNVLVLIAIVPYLFDAYPPAGTLSALTAAASFRVICAGFLPLVIIQMFTGLTGAWALSVFGFISAACFPIPFVLFKWGPRLRSNSRYSQRMTHRPAAGHDDHAQMIPLV